MQFGKSLDDYAGDQGVLMNSSRIWRIGEIVMIDGDE